MNKVVAILKKAGTLLAFFILIGKTIQFFIKEYEKLGLSGEELDNALASTRGGSGSDTLNSGKNDNENKDSGTTV